MRAIIALMWTGHYTAFMHLPCLTLLLVYYYRSNLRNIEVSSGEFVNCSQQVTSPLTFDALGWLPQD